MANRIGFENLESFLAKNYVVASTIPEVFKNLRENYQRFQKVTDQDLLALSSVFGETFEKALEIVEGNKITYYHTNLDIGIYQIEGNSNKTYTIFPSINYCPCPYYSYQVSGGFQKICKHVLATVIADVINRKHAIEVTKEHLNDLLLQSVFKMNDREDWHSRNSYVEQFMYPSPGVSPFGTMPSNWVHVPPQTMPWGLPPESHPSVVRFTAGDFNPHITSIKRKCEPEVEMPPAKMLVTEEKMAAHMRGLSISDADTSNSGAMGVKEEPMETERLPRLIISDEIKNLKTESIIPESILKKLEKPEMALVLWQPPAVDLGSKLRELKKLSITKEKDKNTNKDDKEDREMDIAIETESNNVDAVFRPIDPVPMPEMPNQYFQPVPQFHGYSPFSSVAKPFS